MEFYCSIISSISSNATGLLSLELDPDSSKFHSSSNFSYPSKTYAVSISYSLFIPDPNSYCEQRASSIYF